MAAPMLSVDELLAHMKSEGIRFGIMSVEEAKAYLNQNNSYFKLTSYRKNYLKCTSGVNAGKYEDLEFAHLVELARIDRLFQQTILSLCLDVEHFLKVRLLTAIKEAPGEDGYGIVSSYIFGEANQSFAQRASNAASRARPISNKLERNRNDPYCGGLIRKHTDHMPVWAFIELVTFGDLLHFAEYAAERIGWRLPVDLKTLDRVRQVRNAAAHNNCILNDLTPVTSPETGKPHAKEPLTITQMMAGAGISRQSARKKLSNRRISQIVHLLYAFDRMVTGEDTRNARLRELEELLEQQMLLHREYFTANQLLVTTYDVFRKLVRSLRPQP